MIDRVASRVCNQFALDGIITSTERYSLGKMLEDIFGQLPSVLLVQDVDKDIPECDELAAQIAEEAKELLAEKEKEISTEIFREAERQIMLRTVDLKWMDHIDALDQLSNSIRMRSIGQHDPVVEYKLEGSAMFEEMNENIQNDAVKFIMRARFTPETHIEIKPQVREMKENHANAPSVTPQSAAKPIQGSTGNNAPMAPVKRDSSKVGRNDPCPCGSGKKYKDCCGKK